MRKYECFFIVHPELNDEALTAVADKLKGIIETNGGTVVSYTPWGKKKLAYPVKKNDFGYYILMEFASEPTLIVELERNLRLDERVLKFITVKLEDQYSPEEEPEQEPEEAEEAPAEAERQEPVQEGTEAEEAAATEQQEQP